MGMAAPCGYGGSSVGRADPPAPPPPYGCPLGVWRLLVGMAAPCGYGGSLWVWRLLVGMAAPCGYGGSLWVWRVIVGMAAHCGYGGFLSEPTVVIWLVWMILYDAALVSMLVFIRLVRILRPSLFWTHAPVLLVPLLTSSCLTRRLAFPRRPTHRHSVRASVCEGDLACLPLPSLAGQLTCLAI